nr:hypothetical protein [Tanacetum cinerariifolium]
CVVIRDIPDVFVSKKKVPVKVDRGKGIDQLSDVALLEATRLKKALKKNKQEVHKLHASGSGNGVGSQLKQVEDDAYVTLTAAHVTQKTEGYLNRYHHYSSTSSVNCLRVSGVKLLMPSLLIRNLILSLPRALVKRSASWYGYEKITKKWSKPDKNEHEIVKIAQKPDPKTFLKMPNTQSEASMTREEVEELVARRVAEEMEAREAARNLETLNENGDEQEGENGGKEEIEMKIMDEMGMEKKGEMEMEGMEKIGIMA